MERTKDKTCGQKMGFPPLIESPLAKLPKEILEQIFSIHFDMPNV